MPHVVGKTIEKGLRRKHVHTLCVVDPLDAHTDLTHTSRCAHERALSRIEQPLFKGHIMFGRRVLLGANSLFASTSEHLIQ